MKPSEVARRRLWNLRLAGASFEAADEVVHWHGAMQAQDYGPAKWSIGQRATGLTDKDIDGAVASGSILRTHVLRPTWHFVARDDLRWLLALTGPRVQQHNSPRYRELGLDEQTLGRCEKAIVSALEGRNQLTRDQIATVLDDARIDRAGQRLPYVLMHCELEAVICSGGRAGKHHTYALVEERVPKGRRFDRGVALVELTRRYLASHGPATIQDLRWWSSLKTGDIKQALESLSGDVESHTVGDRTLWTLATDSEEGPARGAHLLQTFDEFIVGYTESRFFGDPRADLARAAWQDRGVPRDLVILDGRIAGLWRRTIGKSSTNVQVVTYDRLKPTETRALDVAASEFGRFLVREVNLDVKRL